MSKSIYRYILQVEVAFLMNYKVNPFDLFGNLSVLDLQTYVNNIESQLEAEQKDKKNGGKDLGKSLMAIHDILNYMDG